VPYPCKAVAIVPFGTKGRSDARVIIDASQNKPWGDTSLYYEPTYRDPGSIEPSAGTDGDGGAEITTPWTFLIGPGRKVLAVRAPTARFGSTTGCNRIFQTR